MNKLLTWSMAALAIWIVTGNEPIHASEREAQQKVQALGEEAIAKTTESLPAIERWFQQTLLEDFDMPAICQFVLRAQWRTITPDQRQRFQSAFVDQLTKLYAQRFQDFSGATFTVERSRQRGNRFVVSSTIRKSPGAPVSKVDWTLNKPLKITDVQIEGVSMLITKRQEYSSFLAAQGRTIDDLIHSMRAAS